MHHAEVQAGCGLKVWPSGQCDSNPSAVHHWPSPSCSCALAEQATPRDKPGITSPAELAWPTQKRMLAELGARSGADSQMGPVHRAFPRPLAHRGMTLRLAAQGQDATRSLTAQRLASLASSSGETACCRCAGQLVQSADPPLSTPACLPAPDALAGCAGPRQLQVEPPAAHSQPGQLLGGDHLAAADAQGGWSRLQTCLCPNPTCLRLTLWLAAQRQDSYRSTPLRRTASLASSSGETTSGASLLSCDSFSGCGPHAGAQGFGLRVWG